MPPDEGKAILLARLKNAEPSRKLQDEQWDDIITKFKKHGMPLYLKVAFEEAKWWKSYDGLPECMDGEKGIPETTEGAIHNLLWRLEKANNHGEVQVRKSLGYIAASRYGLDEHEIMGVLGSDEEYIDFFKATHQHEIPKATADGQRIPIIVWSRLHFDMKPYLNEHSVENASLVNFYHRLVGEVVAQRYLTESDKNSFHLGLADYFENRSDENRKVLEYPWQLHEGESWERLFKLLSDIDFFYKAWSKDKFDVKRYWASIERASKEKAGEDKEPEFTILKSYKDAINNPESVNSSILSELGALLRDTGYLQEALTISEHLIKHFREKGDSSKLSTSLTYQTVIYYRFGKLNEAMKLQKEVEVICRKLGDKTGLSKSLIIQGSIHYAWGKLDEAMKLHKEGEVICREVSYKAGLSATLIDQASIHYARGKFDKAMKLYKEGEVICRELGYKAQLFASLNNQAEILKDWGKFDDAMKLHKEGEIICRELGDREHLTGSLNNQAEILTIWGKLDDAMKLHKEGEVICRKLGYKAGLSLTLNNQAEILIIWGKLNEAMKLQKENEVICREHGYKDGLSRSLVNQAKILRDWDKLDEAVKLAEEAFNMATDHGYTPIAQEIKPIMDEIRDAIDNQNKD
jgi:tetratricopeptide (TPR) repeat protein